MTVKLLVCYHKPSQLLKDDILTPIHVGRALAQKRLEHESETYRWLMNNLIGDDTGENISLKNGSYNEMTSLYWAWKNYDQLGNPDYIGMMHYRRHFIFRDGEKDVVSFEGMGEHYFEEINYSPEKIQNFLQGCDFVTHIGKVNHVYRHYLENHRKEDIDLAFEILYEKYPEYREIAKEYFAGDESNFCNMFIFSRALFFKYCEWIFDILEEFERRVDTSEKRAKEYFAGDESNFCNMFIFSRALFFKYCEWIFDILEEFERRVDTSEKRFFISERLTGVFIAGLMKDQALKYKIVPIAFVREPVNVPVVIPVSEKNEFATAVTITSLLVNKKKESRYDIYLIGSEERKENTEEKFRIFEKMYNGCSLTYLSTNVEQDFYPLIVPELLPELKKCIYMEENSIAMKDLCEFFRTCSVDDFWAVGAPSKSYDPEMQKKEINPSFVVLNCERFRKHQIFQMAAEKMLEGKDGCGIFNGLLAGEVGYVPWYFMTVVNTASSRNLFDAEKSRGTYQAEAVWKEILFYRDDLPWENPQGVYSNFWWNMAKRVPVIFPFVTCSLYALEEEINGQQREINRIAHGSSRTQGEERQQQGENRQAEWRNYSLWGKLKFYYIHNGWKQTVRYAFQKLRGGEG